MILSHVGEPARCIVNMIDRNALSFLSLCEAQKHRCVQEKLAKFTKDCSINGSQWTQWLKCKVRLKKLIYSLMLALGRTYQEKYCPSHFPAAFVSVATIYQFCSQGVELDGPLH